MVDDPPPGAIDAAVDPVLDLHPRHSLHAEDLQRHAVPACVGRGDALDVLVVLRLGVLDHRVDGGEFLGAFGAAEVLGFLVVVQDHLVLEGLLAVEAERTQTGHVATIAAHSIINNIPK